MLLTSLVNWARRTSKSTNLARTVDHLAAWVDRKISNLLVHPISLLILVLACTLFKKRFRRMSTGMKVLRASLSRTCLLVILSMRLKSLLSVAGPQRRFSLPKQEVKNCSTKLRKATLPNRKTHMFVKLSKPSSTMTSPRLSIPLLVHICKCRDSFSIVPGARSWLMSLLIKITQN